MHSRSAISVKPSRWLPGWLQAAFVPTWAWVAYGLMVVPCILVIPMSFAGEDQLVFPPRQFSLDLYRKFFGSVVWMEALKQSVVVASGTAVLATCIGVSAAYGFVRGRFFGRSVIGFLLFSPMLVPAVVLALGVYLYFARLGLTSTTLGIVFAHTVLTLPFVVVTSSSGMRQIDVNVELAATMMGASRFVILTRVVLPQVWPSVLASALLAFLISFDEAVLTWFIAGAGTATLPVVMFSSLKSEVSPIIAAAATLLMTTTMLLSLIIALLTKRASDE